MKKIILICYIVLIDITANGREVNLLKESFFGDNFNFSFANIIDARQNKSKIVISK